MNPFAVEYTYYMHLCIRCQYVSANNPRGMGNEKCKQSVKGVDFCVYMV